MPDTNSTTTRRAVRMDMPLFLQATLRELYRGDWRAVEEALLADSETEKVIKRLVAAHEAVSATWAAVTDAHAGFMARADESPVRNARDSRAAAEGAIKAVLPGIESTVGRARGRWHELGARIDKALADAAERWAFGSEVRARVLSASSDIARYELVRNFILAGDRDSAGAVLGAPRAVTGVTAQHVELLRSDWEKRFFADEGHMRAALQSGADQVEKDAAALQSHLEAMTDEKRAEAEVARVAAAAARERRRA